MNINIIRTPFEYTADLGNCSVFKNNILYLFLVNSDDICYLIPVKDI